MFKLLTPTNAEDADYLAQMHNLRYRIFYKTLGWRQGMRMVSQMEFDDYDHNSSFYLVHINENNRVDACTRLTSTAQPYLLGNAFGHFIQSVPIPQDSHIVETSRLCADFETAPKNMTGQLMGAMLEIGCKLGITDYVSLSDLRIKPVVVRFGWAPQELGTPQHTATELSVALKYPVNDMFHQQVKDKIGQQKDFFENIEEIAAFQDFKSYLQFDPNTSDIPPTLNFIR